MKRTLSVLVENRPGVLTRVAGLFSRRGYNIESLAVGQTENPSISRMTIVVDGDERVIEQVCKQLNKLIDVIKLSDITEDPHVGRELVLIKVNADPSVRGEIMQIVDIFRAHIVDVSRTSLIVEATGDEDKIAALEEALRPFGIREVARTGKIAMVRGSKQKPQEVHGSSEIAL
ncbi:MAG: acetolactate synthase small subunit [Clostridia bacterium]|nr:acetolactate synthase small subunit [Clostridia bacterium]